MTLSGSYNSIDYSLRKNKFVERKMIIDIVHRLYNFDNLHNYRYVGMGAIHFMDFLLMHKFTGIVKMNGIEGKLEDKPRFEFNKPYDCIDMMYGHSNDVLPTLKWEDRVILWLDYDGVISDNLLKDVDTFFSSARSGSLFMVTVNVVPPRYSLSIEEKKEYLVNMISRKFLHSNYEKFHETSFNKSIFPILIKDIINMKINDILLKRNGSLDEENQLYFDPFIGFVYEDGATMLTFGGILYSKQEIDRLKNCEFETMEFSVKHPPIDFTKPFKNNKIKDYLYGIDVPILTQKEMRLMERYSPGLVNFDDMLLDLIARDVYDELPFDQKGTTKIESIKRNITDLRQSRYKGIKYGDLIKYSKWYRYFPSFLHVDL